MIELFQAAKDLLKKGESFVIGTVIRTKGSTPQKPGAKMLIRQDDSTVGTLGGGCVEGDIWHLAQQMFKKKTGPVFRKHTLNEDLAARDGLVCGGTMYVFIEPVYASAPADIFVDEIVQAYEGGPSIAVATIVAEPAPASRIGKKMLIMEDGSTKGKPGKVALDDEIVKMGRSIAAFGENKYIMLPGGVEIFIEGFTTQPTMILIGGGHVNKAVSSLAASLGFRIYVVDDRPEFANKERFPEAEDVVIAEYNDGLNHTPVNANTYIIVATRGHRYDDLALKSAIETPARFVGLLGSKRKILTIYRNLLSENISPERLQKVHAPLGLHVGAITPAEIAVSIMAEIIMVRRGGDGAPLTMSTDYLDSVLHDRPA